MLGISTIGGSQHLRAKGMLAAGGLDAEKDITSIQINDQTMQLQALINNSVQITALSPPWVAVARDKFKMNILDSALERFAGIDSGLVVSLKLLQEKPDLVKKDFAGAGQGQPVIIWRTSAKEVNSWRGFIKSISRRPWNPTALPSRRLPARAFPTDDEVKEHLANDAQTLKLPEPVPPSKIVDFTIQSEVLRELGIKG